MNWCWRRLTKLNRVNRLKEKADVRYSPLVSILHWPALNDLHLVIYNDAQVCVLSGRWVKCQTPQLYLSWLWRPAGFLLIQTEWFNNTGQKLNHRSVKSLICTHSDVRPAALNCFRCWFPSLAPYITLHSICVYFRNSKYIHKGKSNPCLVNGNVYLTCLRQTLTLKGKHCLWDDSSLWLDLGNKSPLVEARGILLFLVGYSRKQIKYAGIHKFRINSFVACQICKTTGFSLMKVCFVANKLYV